MFTLRKFLSCCAVLGVLTFLGTTLLEMPVSEHQSNLHGQPAGAGNFIRTALDQASPETRQDLAELNVHLQSFSASAGLFIDRNITTARLQLAGMTNSIPSHFADWLPTSALNWTHGGAQVAAQNAGAKASEMARKVPVVSSAINSTSNHFAAVRNSLSNAAGF
jgi:hypothetical protein